LGSPPRLFEAARGVAALCQQSGAQLVIDDRADFAMLLQAGLHVGQDDLPPEDARRLLGPNAMLGFLQSQCRATSRSGRGAVDYVAIGPVFRNRVQAQPGPVVGNRGSAPIARARTKPPWRSAASPWKTLWRSARGRRFGGRHRRHASAPATAGHTRTDGTMAATRDNV